MNNEKIKNLIILLTVLSTSVTFAYELPNIIFFLADDQRDDVLGCYGNSVAETPTLDRLASEGTRFNNSFCEAPICAASRSTIFSGLTQRTHGYNFGEPDVPAKYIATSYPMMLKLAGYRIGFAGKYGMAFASPGLKEEFDFFKAIDRNPYLKKMPDGTFRHETDLCADAAIEFIESNQAAQPFCMSVSFNATHAEDSDHRPGYHFQWPESTNGLYEDIEIPPPNLDAASYFVAMPSFLQDQGNLNRERFFWRWDTPEKYQINMRAYYRMTTGIDNAIARVLTVLAAKGLDKNTIIVYSADNGLLLGDRGTAGKWNHYEQSLRVPLIIYDPRLPEVQHGQVVTKLVSNIDLAPTFLDMAGIDTPAVYQGRSLVPLVTGMLTDSWRDEIYCEHRFNKSNNWRANNWRGIRTEKYKYAIYFDEPGGGYECLYDLEKDPSELNNLSANPEYAPMLKEMQIRLDSQLQALPEVRSSLPVVPSAPEI